MRLAILSDARSSYLPCVAEKIRRVRIIQVVRILKQRFDDGAGLVVDEEDGVRQVEKASLTGSDPRREPLRDGLLRWPDERPAAVWRGT